MTVQKSFRFTRDFKYDMPRYDSVSPSNFLIVTRLTDTEKNSLSCLPYSTIS